MKILITGGHLTPALALIEELQQRKHEVVYIGRVSSFADGEGPSVEGEVVKKLGVKYYGINPVKLQRDYNLRNLLSLPKFPYTVIQAAKIIRRESPDVVVSFGGYVAVPFAVAAYLQKIPVLTHEQTTVIGLSNQIISRLAKKIAISWEESASFFPKKKVAYTGNLLRKALFAVAESNQPPQKDVIYITGGNQGSHIINQAVENGLVDLLTDYTIYHQVGNAPAYNDLEHLLELKKSLPPKLQAKYTVAKWFDTDEVVRISQKAAIVVGRSGANTVSEIAALGKVALFIPIPWSSHNEQFLNAQLLVSRGSAMIINQPELNPRVLKNSLDMMIRQFDLYATQAEKNKSLVSKDASAKLADLIESLL